jgi:NitT/TauT family transport system permease protein
MTTRNTVDRLLTPKIPISKTLEIGAGTSVAIGILVVWCVLTYGGIINPNFLPTPGAVVAAFFKVLSNGSLLKHTKVSLTEIYVGFFLSSAIAIPVGIMMGSFRIVAAAIEPVVNFMRYLPVTSMIPLLILWIGIGIEEKIAIIFLGTFFQQIVLAADVASRIPDDILNVSYTLGASKRQVVTRVLIPATLPGVMDTLRVTMGWAWTFLVVAELVAANSGLGYMILQAMRGLHPDRIFVGIFVIGFLGLGTDLAFKWLTRALLPWTEVR